MKSKSVTKLALRTASRKAALLAGMAATTIGTTVSAFASDNLFQTMNANNQTVLDEITTFCDKTILPWVVLAFFLSLGLSGSNEKAVSTLKQAAKVIVIAFIGLNLVNLVVNTIIWAANTFGGATS